MILNQEFVNNNKEKIVSVQTISGTGAVRLAAEFISKFFPNRTCYISKPSWGNHKSIFGECHIKTADYRYWNAKTLGLDMDGMLSDFKDAPNGSIILLHACAHNPTGIDPTKEQWNQIKELMAEKNHIILFDSAYQGFASGDLDRDAFSIRLFASQGFEILICQSFAKNFGLYGERVGAFHVVLNNTQHTKSVHSQLNQLIRASYSNPPKYGSTIVSRILNDKVFFEQWKLNLQTMAGRIQSMRQHLFDALVLRATPGTWDHITKQIGMFSFTGLSGI